MKVTSGRLLDATAYAGRMVVRAQARGPGGGLVRVRRGLRVLVAGISVAVVLFGIGGAAGVMRQRPEPPAAAGSVPDNRSEVESATAQARASGARVEVVGARSETRQVFAQPSGAFTMELNDRPIRVRRGGGWVSPDPTLQARQDGTVTPVAAARPLVLSGGGSAAPLVRLADGDRSIELRWPDPLPVPVVAGDTATYSDVFPDVDLRVRAGVQGFSEVLVVKTRQAARDPRLANVRFGLATVGLTARLTAYGGVSLTDQTGTPVLASSTVHMWDSGTRRGKGALELSAGHLAVVPDRVLLTDPDVTYPVYIDPDFNPPFLGWTKVFSGYPTNNYWNGGVDDGLAKVGQCWNGRGECNGIGAARSFWQFEISALRGADIHGAEFNLHGIHSPSCDARVFRVFQVGPIDGGTTWNNQPGGWWGPLLPGPGRPEWNVAFGRAGCPASWFGIDAGQSIINRINDGSNVATFAVVAGNEGDQLAWRKFDAGTLIVHYNWKPNVPTGLYSNVGQGPSLGCADDPAKSSTFSPRPTLHATLSDRDGQNLEAEFEWWVWNGAFVGSTQTVFQPGGPAFAATIPAGAFANGSRIAWRVRGGDNIVWGPWSQWCGLTVDQTPPGRPGLTSTDYPEGQVAGYVGKTGVFSVTAGDADLLGFQWSLNFQDLPPVDVNSPFFVRASGGGATIRATPTRNGPNNLYVRAVDRAFNVSPVYEKPDGNGGFVKGGYEFTVGSAIPAPVGYWPLDGRHLTTAAPDASGGGHHGTVTGIHPATGAAWAAGRDGDALRFNGTTGHVSTTGRTVNTAGTFSVSAWVNLDAADTVNRAAVSQDGNRVFGFFLGYAGDQRRFTFRMVPQDSETVTTVRAISNAAPTVGVWTHLTGVYDVGVKQMRLYVNGTLHGTATLNTPWSTPNGAVQIGRARYAGNYIDRWTGRLDEVRVWDRLLVDSEIQRLANSPTVEEGFLPLDESTGTRAADESGNYRTGALTGGASWVPGVVGDGAVRFDGVDDAITTGQQAVRTDGSFTVTARARLDATNGNFQTVVSQDGPNSSGFALQYLPSTRKWAMVVSPADAANPVWLSAQSAAPARAGEWIHLAGVYDAAAGQVRLYVNGEEHAAPARITAHVPGNLVIARAKQSGGLVAYFGGRIDDVHVYTGVRTLDEIVADNVNPVTARPTVHTGQLSRYSDHTWRHFVTSGPVPPSQTFEHGLGMLVPPGPPDTRMLYSCQYVSGQFTSIQANCEGYTLLGEIGLLYITPPADVPTMAVYRCLVESTGDHFVSVNADCEGQRNEGRQGYTIGYRKLIRYVKEYPPHDHWSTVIGTAYTTAGYRAEGSHGLVSMTTEGTLPLMSCVDGVDQFLSTDPGCEGKPGGYWIANIWADPPPQAQESAPLYACRVATAGERFVSGDEFCEGHTVLGRLGYLITRL